MERLSSKYLYHYKKDLSIVQEVIRKGFSHRMWNEKVLFRNSIQQNFVVCFCDILKQHSNYHKECYGENVLVLTKEWGIENGVSPVRYVHANSIGIREEYIKIKNINREIRNKNIAPSNSFQFAYDYLAFSLAKDEGLISKPTIQESQNVEANFNKFLQQFDIEFKDIEQEFERLGKYQILQKYLNSLGNRFIELHNELENRDSYIRIYKDDFDCPTGKHISGKILYDEREWRSVKFINSEDYKSNSNEYFEAVRNKFLPERFNLIFTEDDLVAILVPNSEDKNKLENFIKKENTLISKIDFEKIKLFQDFVDK